MKRTLKIIPSPSLTGEGPGGGPNSLKFKTTAIAKTLRKRSTDTENILWKHLRRKRLAGIIFRRQQPIDDYVVDFVSFEKRIIIEIDGGQHSLEADKDAER
jgi:very-short-patch-repair endonuclease